MRRPSPVKISRHREATDMRLSPFDFLYIKVHGKFMRSQNKETKEEEEEEEDQ